MCKVSCLCFAVAAFAAGGHGTLASTTRRRDACRLSKTRPFVRYAFVRVSICRVTSTTPAFGRGGKPPLEVSSRTVIKITEF